MSNTRGPKIRPEHVLIRFTEITIWTIFTILFLDNASGQAENLSSTSNIDKSQNISDDDSDEGTLFKNTAQMNQKLLKKNIILFFKI